MSPAHAPTRPPASTSAEEEAPAPAGAPRGHGDPGRPTPVALVGAGYIAAYHAEILARRPDVEVVAVCDVQRARAEELARKHGIGQAVDSIHELARLGVRVAHVLVPPEHHAAVTRELLEAGIGAFVEKPLALASADARELTELARRRALPLGVNHNARFHPAFVRLLERVRGGRIGGVQHVQVTLSVPLRQLDAGDVSHWMFREPRNIVFEQAPHPFAQLVELAGRVAELDVRILATRELLPGRPFHERWLLSGRGSSGATVELYFAFGQPFARSSIQVLGTDGAVEADLHHDLVAWEDKTPWLDFWNSFLAGWRRGRELRRSARRGLFHWCRQTLGLGPRQDAFYAGMRDSIGAFHEALRHEAAPPVDGDHGTAVLEWCEAAVADVAPATPEPALPAQAGEPRAGEVCVLGGTGFIGRRTVAALLSAGLPVTCAVRRRHGLPPAVADGARAGDVRLVDARLEDPTALAEAVRGARVVLHLATGGGDTWEDVERSMVGGTRAVAEACLAAGVERLVYVSSTAALYLGPDCGHDVLSDDVGPDPRPEARAIYARGKIEAERELARLHAERGLPVTVVRPAVVVGPGTPLQHSGLGLWARDNHCVGWGRGTRPVPLVLADDVADALVRLARHAGTDLDGRALNLAARPDVTAPQAVAAFRRATGRALHFHPRALWLSQAMEIGKWLVKRVGGRRDAAFPSYRDLKSRSLHPELACETARGVLGWEPCDDGAELLRRALGLAPDRDTPPESAR